MTRLPGLISWELLVMPFAIVCSAVSSSWPDGSTVLPVGFSPCRIGLVGVNGSGKSDAAAPGASANEAGTVACSQYALRPSMPEGGGSLASAVS